MASEWQALHGASVPKDPTSSFSLTAPPNTDIWRRSDDDDVFNAPLIYQKLSASDFKSISVTVFAPWQTQYDQGGLLLAFPSKDGAGPMKWIKAGIEYFATEAVLGIVGTDRYSDWSLSPMHTEYHQKARFKVEREGSTVWVYAAQEGAEKMLPMREIKWAFLEDRLEGEVWVGCYAAKPTPEEGGEEEAEKGLNVQFTDLKLERAE